MRHTVLFPTRAIAAILGFAALTVLGGCAVLEKKEAVVKAAERLLLERPALVSVSHWPAAPWPGETIEARAVFHPLPEGAVVQATWRGLTGGIQGKTGSVVLQPDANPDAFTGDLVCRGALSTGLRTGDALAYRIEVVTPGRSEPWVSYEESLLVSPKGSELRALWVQTWAPAIFTSEQCKKLVDDARRANQNAICVEIRRRGDAFYESSFEPKNPSIKPEDFDPLAELIRLGHDTSGGKARVEIHGWFVIFPVGRADTAKKYAEWGTRLRDGSIPSGETIFDPGHPGAIDYTVDVIADCVSKYELDGVNYDYVRYLEGQSRPRTDALALYRTDKNLAPDAKVDTDSDVWKEWVKVQPDGSVFTTIPTGYNPVSVQRFNRAQGRAADSVPEQNDPAWRQWKRDQVTSFVRKAYARIQQIRPGCMVSADTTGFGGIKTWESSAPMTQVFQDWTGWMRSQFIDANFHMGYKRDHVPAQKQDFRNWTKFMIDNDGARFQTVGFGTYMNLPEAYRAQVEYSRSLRAPGLIGYCYQGYAPKDANMTLEEWLDWAREKIFPTPVTRPAMAWKVHPQTGLIQGTVLKSDGSPVDSGRAILLGKDGLPPSGLLGTDIETFTDGAGYFVFSRIPPGEYSVAVLDRDGGAAKGNPVTVAAGAVAEAF
jgi:uncharacterized lipoprotein YddW (UPF0748 family)